MLYTLRNALGAKQQQFAGFLASLLVSAKEMNSKEEEIQNSLLKLMIYLFLFLFLASVEIFAQLDGKYMPLLNLFLCVAFFLVDIDKLL